MTNGHEHDAGERYFYGAVPVFLVDDVAAAVEYYRDILGFDIDFVLEEYGRVARDAAVIDFIRSEPPGRRNSMASAGVEKGSDAVIIVSDIEDIYIEIQEHGANVIERLAVRAYGVLDCMIEDLNGYRVTIGGDLEEEPDGGRAWTSITC